MIWRDAISSPTSTVCWSGRLTTRGSPPASPPSCSRSRRSPRSTRAAAARPASGVTAIVSAQRAVPAAAVRGGAPAPRETDLLEPHRTAERIDAVVLSGGSAFGLDAGAGVQAWLREQGRGFAIGDVRVPLVAGASMFDLLNGGNKDWG